MLIPDFNHDIPDNTAEVARAAFPKGNPYLTLRDELGTVFADEDFVDLFPDRGQPALSPWRLALVTILQFRENLPDRQAADAVRGRIDWKYLLGLELTDPGFDFSVLSEFRDRLLQGSAEELLLEKILEHCLSLGLVKAGGKQRTDSTRVLAAIRDVNRLELVGETVRAALNQLAMILGWENYENLIFTYPPFKPGYFKTAIRGRDFNNSMPDKYKLEYQIKSSQDSYEIASRLFNIKKTIDFRLYQERARGWELIRNRKP